MPLLIRRAFSSSHRPLRRTKPAIVEKKPPPTVIKSVAFSSEVSVQEVMHLADMSDEAKSSTWYSKEEYKIMKESMLSLVCLMVEGKVEEGVCTRGLEHRTPAASKERKRNKRYCYKAVWETQESQWEDGKFDAESIAFLYQTETFKSRQTAIKRGFDDEKVAMSLYTEEELSER
eukprot:scaffold9191_cov114-Cylindrotheca_fusiformis.AAC.15